MKENAEKAQPTTDKLFSRIHVGMEKTEADLKDAIKLTDNQDLRKKLPQMARQIHDMQM